MSGLQLWDTLDTVCTRYGTILFLLYIYIYSCAFVRRCLFQVLGESHMDVGCHLSITFASTLVN